MPSKTQRFSRDSEKSSKCREHWRQQLQGSPEHLVGSENYRQSRIDSLDGSSIRLIKPAEHAALRKTVNSKPSEDTSVT